VSRDQRLDRGDALAQQISDRAYPPNSAILVMSSTRLAGVVAAIIERPGGDHNVATLAAMAGLSCSRFCHNFLAAYHCSPAAFVQAARLVAAARVLPM
jgi:transcriptional regulator GlxA family with amidase domain